jgi:methionine synthase II (cobalamin-independent)
MEELAMTSHGGLAPAGRPVGVHLTGSVPLADNESAFRSVSGILGRHLRRLPDGETGKRSRWNSWTAPSYERTSGLELVLPPEGNYTPWKQARLTIDPSRLVLERLGFADAALDSYRVFARLKEEGIVPRHVRLQVCLPSPIAPMILLVAEDSRAAVEPAHIRQLDAELGEILDGVPHDQLAVQWDVCQDVGIWEGHYPAYFDDQRRGVTERLAARAQAVPADVEVGFHLCYGDFGRKHFMQPADTAVAVAIANSVVATAGRQVNWVHLPVPADRDDEAYFAPLRKLALDPATELYLGLIHDHDGVPGVLRRLQGARTAVRDFGIATECGFGRRPADSIPALLRLHAELADPVS